MVGTQKILSAVAAEKVMLMSDQEIEEIASQAEEVAERYTEARDVISGLKDKLRDRVDELLDEDIISHNQWNALQDRIDDGDYEEVRKKVVDYADSAKLQFSDQDIQSFAALFADALDSMRATLESVRTSMRDLQSSSLSQGDLVAFLYGKHSSLRKGDIEKVLSAVQEYEEGGFSDKQLARFITAIEPSLNLKPTKKILQALREEADADE